MPIALRNKHYVPSGIPAGSELAGPLRTALAAYAGLPLPLYPIIEEGTYDEFKACIFRVLAFRICEVSMEDIKAECREHGINCGMFRREWGYHQTPSKLQCVTSVQMRMSMSRTDVTDVDVKGFMQYLSQRYEFIYNRMTVNRKTCTQIDDRIFLDSSIEVEAEIMWPYWT